MKQLEFINHILASIQFLNKQEFNRYVSILLAGFGLIALLSTYYVYSTSSSLVHHIKQLQESSKKTMQIMHDYEKLHDEEHQLTAQLEKKSDFSIRPFFEKFCKDNNVTAEANWSDTVESNPVPLYPQFEEEAVKPVFKNQTTQTVIKIFEALEKEPMVSVKEIHLTVEGTVLTAELTIAGKKNATFKKNEE